MRLRFLHIAVISLFLFLAACLLNLEIIQGIKFKEMSQKNCIRLIPQPGARGNILDRNAKVIAASSISYDIVMLPQERDQLEKTLLSLSALTGISAENLKDRFFKNYVTPSVPVTLVKNISREKAIAIEEKKPYLAGVMISPAPIRWYPYGDLACHVLGYLSEIDRWRLTKLEDYGYKTKDVVGFDGIEEKFDFYLRQEDGGLSVEVDHRGRFTRVLGFRPAKSGKDIQLCLDLNIQKIVENSLVGRKGCVVILDPNTGEVMAMASFPAFNPAVFVNKENSAMENILQDSNAPLINRAIRSVYPPGSVFKPIVACAGLETAKITADTSFFCPGSLMVGRREFKCWSTHNQQNLTEGIAHSCDVYFYRTGLLLGPQLIYDYALKFGLARTTGIELPYEESGFIPNPLWKKLHLFQKWYDGDTANFAIGQGEVQTSPLQIARMMAVFANGGKLVNPYIIKAIDGQEASFQHTKKISLHFKKNNIEIIRKGLREVVSDSAGTANVLSGLAVAVAGKTGTAQTGTGKSHGWFAGFFPFEKPKFAICVFLEKAGHGYEACLVTKQIIESMYQEGLI